MLCIESVFNFPRDKSANVILPKAKINFKYLIQRETFTVRASSLTTHECWFLYYSFLSPDLHSEHSPCISLYSTWDPAFVSVTVEIWSVMVWIMVLLGLLFVPLKRHLNMSFIKANNKIVEGFNNLQFLITFCFYFFSFSPAIPIEYHDSLQQNVGAELSVQPPCPQTLYISGNWDSTGRARWGLAPTYGPDK